MGWLKSAWEWLIGGRLDDYDFIPFEEAQNDVRFYGDGTTIHGNTGLDIVTYRGEVIEVWYRCQQLPFHQTRLTKDEAAGAKKYPIVNKPEIVGMFLVDTVPAQ